MQIGTATKLSEMADSDLLKKKYPMLVEAINMISSPELRNAIDAGRRPVAGSVVPVSARRLFVLEKRRVTSATARSATTATTIPRWAGACATPSIPATPRPR